MDCYHSFLHTLEMCTQEQVPPHPTRYTATGLDPTFMLGQQSPHLPDHHHQHTGVSQAAALITARLSRGCTAASFPLWHLIIPQGEEVGKNTLQQSVCLMWNIC